MGSVVFSVVIGSIAITLMALAIVYPKSCRNWVGVGIEHGNWLLCLRDLLNNVLLAQLIMLESKASLDICDIGS